MNQIILNNIGSDLNKSNQLAVFLEDKLLSKYEILNNSLEQQEFAVKSTVKGELQQQNKKSSNCELQITLNLPQNYGGKMLAINNYKIMVDIQTPLHSIIFDIINEQFNKANDKKFIEKLECFINEQLIPYDEKQSLNNFRTNSDFKMLISQKILIKIKYSTYSQNKNFTLLLSSLELYRNFIKKAKEKLKDQQIELKKNDNITYFLNKKALINNYKKNQLYEIGFYDGCLFEIKFHESDCYIQ